jgi:hypothetical protein
MNAVPAPVVQVVPGGDVPANLLRWHLFFDRPVDVLAVNCAVTLLDNTGVPVPHAFVDLPDGLWDDTGTRLTLLLHPGRIKSGLRTQGQFGGALAVGQRMTLRIDLDRIVGAEAGRFEHDFSIVPAVERAIDLASWRLGEVAAGSLQPLKIDFGRLLDRLSLDGAMAVGGPNGQVLQGIDSIDAAAGALTFTPLHPWQPGLHRLVVAHDLEDLAGNRVGAAFESPLLGTPPPRWERSFNVPMSPTGSSIPHTGRAHTDSPVMTPIEENP